MLATVGALSLGLGTSSAAAAAAPDSAWNAPLAASAPVASNSAALVRELRRQVTQHGPWINTTAYSTPVYTVGAGQPTVRVQAGGAHGWLLREAWSDVPLPPDAKPAQGSDGELVVYQPSTDTLWEFWQLHKRSDGWHAEWGGKMTHVSTNPGYFDGTFGASSSGLSLMGGLMRTSEMASGSIDHALAVGLPDIKQGGVVWPAQRGDGASTAPDAIPTGTRFRIDPAVDVDALRLPPAAATIAKAVQRYGLVVRDRAGAVVLYGEDPSRLASDPWPALLGDWPDRVLKRLPWDKMQVVVPDRRAFSDPAFAPTDVSPHQRRVTVAGGTPAPVAGKFAGGLAFGGGERLLVPQFELPLQHRMGAWVRPAGDGSSWQVVMGQWKAGSSVGDGAPVAVLVYDGTARRVFYFVIDSEGQWRGAVTPRGSYDPAQPGLRLVEGGIRKSGEVVVGIDGAFHSAGQYAASVDAGDGSTPFSIGDVSNGGESFSGTIDSPFVIGEAAPDTDYSPSLPKPTPSTLLLAPLDW